MYPVRTFQWIGCIVFAACLHGCVVIPVPTSHPEVVYGNIVSEADTKPMVSVGEDIKDVESRLGKPLIDFGPRKVFVYMWAVKSGRVLWFLGGATGGWGGIEPTIDSHLLFVAFGLDGKVLKEGTRRFEHRETIAKQVHDWLSAFSIDSLVIAPHPDLQQDVATKLFVYRPSTSSCKFPEFDHDIFVPSVAVDGTVVGDLARGEYLGVEITAGEHKIEIDPVPYYRFAGQESGFFAGNVLRGKASATLIVTSNNHHSIFIKTYLCTGMGKTVMHATVQDAETSLQAIQTYRPAW